MTHREIYSKLQGSIDATLPPVNPQKPKTDTWSIKDVADTLAKHGLIVEQEPKPGHWIAEENEEMETIGYYCSECDLPMETEKRTDFCPNCGAKMVVPQESGGEE